ncbi:interleukin-23 receptor [Labrus bergylta]|uniref:interleukin-23 receptor n=1 Tax=Labrus bergylta TaxID=56723 RepID=UPI0033137784
MNLYSTIWKYFLVFSLSIKDCPVHPAGLVIFNGLGNLTVEPALPFLLGSNLTVYCHVTECKQRSKILLQHDGKTLALSDRVNCNTAIFNLIHVKVPNSSVLCKLLTDDKLKIVNGLVLRGGYRPDKPEVIFCETTRSSASIDCSWSKGRETHLETVYNISINRENGTQVEFYQIQGAAVITIPRAKINGNSTYELIIIAYNQLGVSKSDPFILCVKDIVIPEPPRIMLTGYLDSTAAVLRWKPTDSPELLRPCVRLHSDKNSWEAGEVSQSSEGLIKVEGLKPLTNYEFQVRTCILTSGPMHSNMSCFTPPSASSKRLLCSKWSSSVRGRSPGKGLSKQLHVWRILGHKGKKGLQMVTVLWKHPNPEDYSGKVQRFEISLGNEQKQNVTANLSQCSVPLSAEVQALSVSAVTLYGTSPPAEVPLRQSGHSGPVLRDFAPASNGSAVSVSWSWPENKRRLSSGDELLHYMLEWTSVPVAVLQWDKVDKDESKTAVTGLTAGVRYNVSVFAVTSRGVSAPSSRLVYSKEQKPQSGPKVSILVHEARQIQIQWDELPVDQQRGFIVNYTIYLQTLDSSNTEHRVTVSGSKLRRRWLDCPHGALALQMTASTSAGEGPRGSRISSQPVTSVVGLGIVMVFIVTLFIGIIAYLLCWSCVRARVKQKCISWGLDCVGEKLPKPGNSLAIRLLKDDRSELSFLSTCSDPPLSPVSLISQEQKDDVYPIIHIELSQMKPGKQTAQTPLLMSDPEATLEDCQLEHVGYKPQISTLAPQGQGLRETEEELKDASSSGLEDRNRGVPGGLLGGFMSSVEGDFCVPPLGLTLISVSDPPWPQTQETTSVMDGGFLMERRGTEHDVELDAACPDLQQGGIKISDPADTCSSQYQTSQTAGYFPQVASVGTLTLSDTQR